MKRLTALCLTIILALSALYIPALAMPGDHEVSYMYVKTGNKGSLNLRQTASADAKVLTRLPYGARLMLYDYKKGDKWALCVYEDFEGYVMTRYLSAAQPAAAPAPTATPQVGTESREYKRMQPAYYYAAVRPSVPTGFVHMRWAPSTAEPIFKDYYNGQILKVLYESGSWCQVYDEENDLCGYMMKKFLNYVADVTEDIAPAIGEGVTVNTDAAPQIGSGAGV